MSNYTYILRCADGSLYTGWTNDLEKRLAAHNAGTASKCTRSRRPVELVWHHISDTRQQAMGLEVRIKRLTRAQKLKLIDGSADLVSLGLVDTSARPSASQSIRKSVEKSQE